MADHGQLALRVNQDGITSYCQCGHASAPQTTAMEAVLALFAHVDADTDKDIPA